MNAHLRSPHRRSPTGRSPSRSLLARRSLVTTLSLLALSALIVACSAAEETSGGGVLDTAGAELQFGGGKDSATTDRASTPDKAQPEISGNDAAGPEEPLLETVTVDLMDAEPLLIDTGEGLAEATTEISVDVPESPLPELIEAVEVTGENDVSDMAEPQGETSSCTSSASCGPSCLPCDEDTPICYEGVCVCNQTSCPGGTWCFELECVACADDDAMHCGETCDLCTGSSPSCVDGACVCADDGACGAGAWCDEGACLNCAADDPLHCGGGCAQCTGAYPHCVDGACSCDDDSCADGEWCDPEGHCLACADGQHCGPECLPCPLETPACVSGVCVSCVDDDDCGADSWCDTGTCVACADDDPLHCGSTCASCGGTSPACEGGACVCAGDSCGAYHVCEIGECRLCNDDKRCGANCEPCGGALPRCPADGAACVQCLSDADCVAADHCAAQVCAPDCTASGCVTDQGPGGKKCSQAVVVGRKDAAVGAWFSADTSDLGANDNTYDGFLEFGPDECWDAAEDSAYRIYMLAGEGLHVTLYPLALQFDAMLKLYTGTACAANDEDDLIDCFNDDDDGGNEVATYTATSDGWISIVVDGRRAFDEDADWGPYNITVTLSCAQANCCCP